MANPWMRSVTTSDTSVHRLIDLLQAIDPDVPLQCAQLRLRLTLSSPGKIFIGNSAVSSTDWGEELTVSQYFDSFARAANDFPLQDIYIVAESASLTRIGVTILLQ